MRCTDPAKNQQKCAFCVPAACYIARAPESKHGLAESPNCPEPLTIIYLTQKWHCGVESLSVALVCSKIENIMELVLVSLSLAKLLLVDLNIERTQNESVECPLLFVVWGWFYLCWVSRLRRFGNTAMVCHVYPYVCCCVECFCEHDMSEVRPYHTTVQWSFPCLPARLMRLKPWHEAPECSSKPINPLCHTNLPVVTRERVVTVVGTF